MAGVNVDQEMWDLILTMLAGSYANTDSPTTSLNRLENQFDLLGISPEIFTGTTWSSYVAPIPFDETPYLNKTLRYLNSTTPAWQSAAENLMSGNYTAADAYYEVSKALGGELAFDKNFIQNEINAMEKEIQERNLALAEHNKSLIEDERTNIYGKAGLPQPYEEFGLERGQTPPPASRQTRDTQARLESLLSELQSSGYEQAMADKEEARARKTGDAAERFYKQNPDSFYDASGKDRRYNVSAKYEPVGSIDELGRSRTDGGIVYDYELAGPSEQEIKEIGDRIRLLAEKSTQPTNNPLSRMIRSGLGQGLQKVTPGYDKVERDLKRIYGPIEQKGVLLAAKAGENARTLDFLRNLDLLSAQKAGKTPLSEAKKERSESVLLPWLMGTLR